MYARALILGDSSTYSPIYSDPTTSFKRSLTELVNEVYSLGILDKKEHSFLVPLAPQIPTIYYLPKVHKDPVNPPGHPIISGIDSVTSRIREFVDFHLQPVVRLVPSYLKNTGATIKLLEFIEYREDTFLVTVDVASLYTCIPHDLGFDAVEYYLLHNTTLSLIQFAPSLANLIMAKWEEDAIYALERPELD